jgi:hypothetical protein
MKSFWKKGSPLARELIEANCFIFSFLGGFFLVSQKQVFAGLEKPAVWLNTVITNRL